MLYIMIKSNDIYYQTLIKVPKKKSRVVRSLENLENLEMSGNFILVRENLEHLEKSGNSVKISQKNISWTKCMIRI